MILPHLYQIILEAVFGSYSLGFLAIDDTSVDSMSCKTTPDIALPVVYGIYGNVSIICCFFICAEY